MTITAKYSSVCPTCGQQIQPGDKVEWNKGTKARHTTCSAGGPSGVTASRPQRMSSGRWTGCSCGSRELSCGTVVPGRSGRMCRQCEFDAE